jgi:hypothetical protein
LTVPVVTLRPSPRSAATIGASSRKCSTQTPRSPALSAHRASASGARPHQTTSRAASPREAARSTAAVWKLRTSIRSASAQPARTLASASTVRRASAASGVRLDVELHGQARRDEVEQLVDQ